MTFDLLSMRRRTLVSMLGLVLALALPLPARAEGWTRITYDVLMKMEPEERRQVVDFATEKSHGGDILAEYWRRYRTASGNSLTEKQAAALDALLSVAENGPEEERARRLKAASTAFGARGKELFSLRAVSRAPHLTASLADLLGQLSSKDADVRARGVIHAGLTKAGDDRVVAALVRLRTQDEAEGLRDLAAWSLAAVGTTAAISAVSRAYTPTAEGSVIAAAFAAHPDRRAVPALLRGLAARDEHVRANAAFALGAIGDARAKNALKPLLKDDRVATVTGFTVVKLDDSGAPVVQMGYSGMRVADVAQRALDRLTTD